MSSDLLDNQKFYKVSGYIATHLNEINAIKKSAVRFHAREVLQELDSEHKALKLVTTDTKAGNTYRGRLQDGKFHGYGVLTYQSGRVDKGIWQQNKLHEGHKHHSNGTCYKGVWENGKQQGIGIQYLCHDDKPAANTQYYGNLLNGKPNGFGIMCYRDASIYVGDWQNAQRHGQGVIFSVKRFYMGQWLNDKRHGFGIHSCYEGEKYDGEWKLNHFHQYDMHEGIEWHLNLYPSQLYGNAELLFHHNRVPT
ncbi:MAG: hypothetical protein HAW66_04265 [Shewanella sp.]|nr:hypothetical protein [Shewanella sp.]